MLCTVQIHLQGRHHTLLPATTFEAARGDLLLVAATGQDRRTALALALTGRMKPSGGSVQLDGRADMKALRRRSAVVDSPAVNAPERHLTVRSLAAEDLVLVPHKFRGRTRPAAWLAARGYAGTTGKWVEELGSTELLKLQLELALANPEVQVLVADSPDRHSTDPDTWLPLLASAAAGQLGREAGRGPVLVAVVAGIPEGWEGPTAYAGNAVPEAPEPDAPEPQTPRRTDRKPKRRSRRPASNAPQCPPNPSPANL